MSLSIIICTHNRCAELAGTLETLAKATPPAKLNWEVLIVDNASTDRTSQVVAEWSTRGLSLRGVFEPVLGLSTARNRALGEARGDSLLFLDDDVDVSPDLITRYEEALASYPEAGFFGGPIIPVLTGTPTRLGIAILRSDPSIFAGVDLGPVVRTIPPMDAPYGANMLIRRSGLGRWRFEPNLGYVGSKGGSGGEETHLFLTLAEEGKVGLWIPGASVAHRIPASRTTWSALRQQAYLAGRGGVRIGVLHGRQRRVSTSLLLWSSFNALRRSCTAALFSWAMPLHRRVGIRFNAWRAVAQLQEGYLHWRRDFTGDRS